MEFVNNRFEKNRIDTVLFDRYLLANFAYRVFANRV